MMKTIRKTGSALRTRWNGKTPKFWKKVQRVGVVAGAIGGVIIASPIALPAAVITAAGYLATAGTVAATLSQSIDFKIDYFDYTGKQSEFTTYLDDVVLNLKSDIPSNTCQDDKVYFYYNSAFGVTSTTQASKAN